MGEALWLDCMIFYNHHAIAITVSTRALWALADDEKQVLFFPR